MLLSPVSSMQMLIGSGIDTAMEFRFETLDRALSIGRLREWLA